MKEFKTLDEQIDILEQKGLVINDKDSAKDILLRENYFFINGYRRLFQKEKGKFIEGTTFEELYGMFLFDRRLRNIFFKNLLVVENNIKSILSYTLSKSYGIKEKDYLAIKNYSDDVMQARQVRDVLNKMSHQIRINGSKHAATYHYLTKYGYVPMWILVKVLSFGLVSEYYDILKYTDKKEIADIYKLDVEVFVCYLQILANYRNICAHEDILYEHKTQRAIQNTKYHDILNIEKNDIDEYNYGKDDLFAVLIILKQMLTDEEFREMIREISYEFDVLDSKTTVVSTNKLLNKIGFPDNWKDLANIH